MTSRSSHDGMYEFEAPPNQKGVWIRHKKERVEMYLFPDDVADLVKFVMEARR